MSEMIRTFKYRLLPTKKQHKALAEILESQRQLYNAALQERIDCYRKTGKGVTYIDQTKSLTIIRKDSEYSSLPVVIQRWTLRRVDNAFKAFFLRVKRGQKPGHPRFRGFNRWRSFGFSQFGGIKINRKCVKVNGMASGLKVHWHREMIGKPVSAIIGKDIKGWYICFQCKFVTPLTEHAGSGVGIDVGLKNFATLSDGTEIPAPQIARKAEKAMRLRQRALSRCKKGSNRRRKVRKQLERLHGKIANTRRTFLHNLTAKLAREHSTIAVEDLQIKNMVKSSMARSIHDAAWGDFINKLTYKAEWAGGQVIKVNPRNTTQACSGCGEIVPKGLKERMHNCPHCGLILDRDHNAALNILARSGAKVSQDKAVAYV